MPQTRPFHQQVDELVARVVEMGAMSHRSVREGVDAFAALDAKAAKRVIEFNQDLNRIDVEIEAKALDLLALHQPMASDLRTIGATLKIITYLDRIGRYGYDIAKATLALEGKQHIKKLVGTRSRGEGADGTAVPSSIPLMTDKALHLLDMSIESFQTRNADVARKVQPADDEVDGLYDQIFRECLTYMIEEPRNITQCTQYILVARHIERVGDNAGKIAEKSIYMATGERRLPTS